MMHKKSLVAGENLLLYESILQRAVKEDKPERVTDWKPTKQKSGLVGVFFVQISYPIVHSEKWRQLL